MTCPSCDNKNAYVIYEDGSCNACHVVSKPKKKYGQRRRAIRQTRNMPVLSKTCIQCGEEFQTKTKRTIYCCAKCANRAAYERREA